MFVSNEMLEQLDDFDDGFNTGIKAAIKLITGYRNTVILNEPEFRILNEIISELEKLKE